jgi:hypothetical protein
MATEDETVDQLTSVFTQAIRLLRDRSKGEVALEMPAMDLLMDYSLLLGPARLAAVLSTLATDKPATRPQVAAALNCYLGTAG